MNNKKQFVKAGKDLKKAQRLANDEPEQLVLVEDEGKVTHIASARYDKPVELPEDAEIMEQNGRLFIKSETLYGRDKFVIAHANFLRESTFVADTPERKAKREASAKVRAMKLKLKKLRQGNRRRGPAR